MWRLAAFALLLSFQAPPAASPITVSAAVSLTDALEAIARAFEASGGGPVRFNFGSSNALGRQIVSGAPVDVYISADAAQMDVVERAGAIDPASRVDLLQNSLAVMTRAGLAGIRDARSLTGPDIRRIAIGDPAGVPAGMYARQFLQAIGLWDGLQPKLVPVNNVRAALTAVETGSVDAAIVYESDAVTARSAAIAFIVSGPAAPRIVYPAGVVAASRNRAAADKFLSYLRGAGAAAIFRRHKFVPIPFVAR